MTSSHTFTSCRPGNGCGSVGVVSYILPYTHPHLLGDLSHTVHRHLRHGHSYDHPRTCEDSLLCQSQSPHIARRQARCCLILASHYGSHTGYCSPAWSTPPWEIEQTIIMSSCCTCNWAGRFLRWKPLRRSSYVCQCGNISIYIYICISDSHLRTYMYINPCQPRDAPIEQEICLQFRFAYMVGSVINGVINYGKKDTR